ncbi:MAG: hypothetical protein KUG77_05470 [Nannocystaceae bacterium]|nr:hypothetical protein [Nannocystaceae bacterium]
MRSLRFALGLVLALGSACDDGNADKPVAKGPIDAPFEVKINKVEVLDEVAPNKTYLENGLGKKAGPGKTFVCVQYEVTNTGGAKSREAGAEGRMKVNVSALPLPKVVDPGGVETDVSTEAAGSYQPADWETKTGDVEPGKSAKKADCFAVAKDKTDGLKFRLSGDVEQQPWTLEVPLPPKA